MTEPLIHQHIRAAVAYEARYEARKQAYIKGYEEEGRRIVDASQTGETSWTVTDYRTGELLARGDGGYEEYSKVVDEVGQHWMDVSHLLEEVYEDGPPVTEGLSKALCDALSDWVEVASPEEIEAALS